MPTIKELYDQGQRQFPMRGGGISPVLLITKPKATWAGRVSEGMLFANYDGLHTAEWFISDGCFIWNDDYIDCVASPFDLLPEPLPNQSERIAELEAHILGMDKCDDANRTEFGLDFFRERIATLEVALIEATDLIEKLHYEHLLGMTWLEDEETKFRAIAGGQDNEL